MASQNMTLNFRTRVNHARAAAMFEYARARLWRARKRDRGALMHRFARDIAQKCVKVEIV